VMEDSSPVGEPVAALAAVDRRPKGRRRMTRAR
jgi:hypothetical protein